MFTISEAWMLVTVVVLHLWGLVSVVVARLDDSMGETRRHLFDVSLLGVGLFAMMAFATGSGFWLPSSATFSLMVVGATLETSAAA